jgi:hypothetical protein
VVVGVREGEEVGEGVTGVEVAVCDAVGHGVAV